MVDPAGLPLGIDANIGGRMTERDARKQVNEHIGRLSPTPLPDLHSGGNGMLVEAVILLLAALVVVILGWVFGAV
jgi:hypothetical protein